MWPAYSVEWSGFLVIDEAGTYEFSTLSDDGSELEVADRIVVSNGGLHGPQEARGSIALDAGVHPFKLRYEQAGGGFTLAVRYGRAGGRMVDIPASRLLPDAMSYTEYRLRHAIPLGGAVLAVLLVDCRPPSRPPSRRRYGPLRRRRRQLGRHRARSIGQAWASPSSSSSASPSAS